MDKQDFSTSEIDFVKYKEQNTIKVIESEKTRRVIGYAIDLISKTDAKNLLETLRAHPNKKFEISTASKNDFGYDFGQKTIKKFNRTLI